MLNLLDKMFVDYIAHVYSDQLHKIEVDQVYHLRIAFYAGAKVISDATTQEPPASAEEEQMLLDSVTDFKAKVSDIPYQKAAAIGCLVDARIQHEARIARN